MHREHPKKKKDDLAQTTNSVRNPGVEGGVEGGQVVRGALSPLMVLVHEEHLLS